MRALALAGLLLAGIGGGTIPAAAQDTAPNPVRAERLRREIEERFGERLKQELALSDDQAVKVRAALAGMAVRRRGFELHERRLRQALAGQLRPGVAANPDSVAKLVDALTAGRVVYAETFRDEMRELGAILTPVQRGQYFLLRDRLMQRVQEILEQRPPGAPGARRGLPPGLP